MGNSYSIYRLSYYIFNDSTVLLINHQMNIIQQEHLKFDVLHNIYEAVVHNSRANCFHKLPPF